ncbi:MAG: GGDEF domain-containing protein [Candidatus Cloacimonetes bacterium]|nr:GGDEF domain-containing protein [Candidatus Cloacimonadota bacterium]
MYYNIKRLLAPLIIPSLLVILAMVLGWQWDKLFTQSDIGEEISAFIIIFPYLPYLLLAIVAVLGLRSKNPDLTMIPLLLILSYFLLRNVYTGNLSDHSILSLILFFVPINICLISFTGKKNFKSTVISYLILIAEFGILAFFYRLYEFSDSNFITQFHVEFPNFAASLYKFTQSVFTVLNNKSFIIGIPLISIFSFFVIITIMTINFVNTRDEKKGGYLFIIILLFLAISSKHNIQHLMIFFTTSALILLITAIESSFSMAYIDELTGLHGRRSLNDTLASLSKNYAIAMIDIDHFKKFNDKYGHKTGDQVLKMAASKLNDISGGGKPFRYGGEEFTVIFAGKTSKEAKPYMEEYREKLSASEFVVRSPIRRSSTAKNRGKKASVNRTTATITVSTGIAEHSKDQTKPEKVLKAADKILYKAKRLGRNRVEIQKRT